jgi:hypothetical protein
VVLLLRETNTTDELLFLSPKSALEHLRRKERKKKWYVV